MSMTGVNPATGRHGLDPCGTGYHSCESSWWEYSLVPGGTEHEEGTGTARNGRVHVRRGRPGLRADGDHAAGREGRREGREEDGEGRREGRQEGREGREEGCQGEGGGR